MLGLYSHLKLLMLCTDVVGFHFHSAALSQGPVTAPRVLSGGVHFATLHMGHLTVPDVFFVIQQNMVLLVLKPLLHLLDSVATHGWVV